MGASTARWQLQEAKQHFSELVRAAEADGAQIVTRHGQDVAVVIDIAEFHRLGGEAPDFKEFLLSGPSFAALDLERDRSGPREIDFSE